MPRCPSSTLLPFFFWGSLIKPNSKKKGTLIIKGLLGNLVGVRIRGTLGDIDPLNKVPFKRARSRVQKGYPLRGLPNDTT